MEKKPDTKRRQFIKSLGLTAGTIAFGGAISFAQEIKPEGKSKRLLRVAHITDIHITGENNAPNRFRKCLTEIKNHKVDFFLNGGDTIMAADYSDKTREEVLEQWKVWDELQKEFNGYEVYACLGNHDMWWAAPDISDPMYGKNYAMKKLDMLKRFYAFTKNNWHFIVLDSNNSNAGSLDEEQHVWLENYLDELPQGASVLVMSHYPILAVSTIPYGGNHTDSKYITKLFFKHQDKKIHCISGHMHLLDTAVYNNVNYYCNGSISGFWWGEGDMDSAAKYFYQETPPGFTIIDLFEDGTIENTYYPHGF
jgi:predicted phosphodiesterase